MSRKIICRFANENDLKTFAEMNEININKNSKFFNIKTTECVDKKETIHKSNSKKEEWREHWMNMPQYLSEKQIPYAKIEFEVDDLSVDFLKNYFNQYVSDKTKSLWFPKLVAGKHSPLRVLEGDGHNPQYPIYVVSKGRHDKCYTSRFLCQMEVKHYVVVEPQEVEKYKELEDDYCSILELDMRFKECYDTFDNLGYEKSIGPGAARNFCWKHSMRDGYSWHWVMDDNALEGFHYMNHNMKIKCRTGAIFGACEDFVGRYKNIAIAGMNYSSFCKMSDKTPAFVMNTRIYSFLLINNSIPYRWRGRYNEDTDLSLNALKDGWCTVQFNAFLAGKATTQKVKGGNTEAFYAEEGTLPKSKMLEDMHPDCAKVVWKFNRWHHQVDYSGFKQKLQFKESYVKPSNVINTYGMKVIMTEEKKTNNSKSYLEKKYSEKLLNDFTLTY